LRIEDLSDEPGNEVDLVFTYCAIIRKLFLYDYIPADENEDLEYQIDENLIAQGVLT